MKLNNIFSSHMVFPANKPIRVFGEGNGKVEISFLGSTKSTVAKDNEWCIEFPAFSYGGPYDMCIKFPEKTIILNDIYVGEVYIFAGQSNMQLKIFESSKSEDKLEANPKMRLFSTNRLEDTDVFHAEDGWIVCEEEDIKNWSAIAYFTSKELCDKKDIAIGAISCYQGGSVIESWVPQGTFEKLGINIDIENKTVAHTVNDEYYWNGDAMLYDFVFSQIFKLSVTGVVWYQGESDASLEEGKVYKYELAELIRIWRNDLMDENLPFFIIQLPDYINRDKEIWELVQKSQMEVQDMVQNVKTIVSTDLCENDNIHPKTKDKLSKRLAETIIKTI